jgi:hypothetical protein
MEDQFVHSASLEVIMGDEAYADLQSRCRFEEVELAERGQEMLWNGKWNWAALSLFIREEIGWLGEGMFVDGTRAAQDGGVVFLKKLALSSIRRFGLMLFVLVTPCCQFGLRPTRRHTQSKPLRTSICFKVSLETKQSIASCYQLVEEYRITLVEEYRITLPAHSRVRLCQDS